MEMEPDPPGDDQQQCLIAIQFGDEHEQPVMMPVDDPGVLDDPDKKEALIDKAWAFYQHGLFARATISPPFIKALADDFARDLPLPNFLACKVCSRLVPAYFDHLEQDVQTHGDAIIDEHAKHLRVERDHSSEDVTIVLDLPEDWEETAIASVQRLVTGFFDTRDTGLSSWYGFTEWIWTNQVARALDDLAQESGEEYLESLSEEDFWTTVLGRMLRHEDSAANFAELLGNHLDTLTDIVVENLVNTATERWLLELLLGFRTLPPPNATIPSHLQPKRIITVDLTSILGRLTKNPHDLYQLTPRTFEEVIAHLFERFGYDVTITAKTRDGGFDISATKRAEADVRLLIECKRYTPPHKVGRPTVQQLYGVLQDRDQHATKGIIATTTGFTSDAKAFLHSNHFRIEGRDYFGIVEWLKRVNGSREK
jgi:restriction system protein